MSTVSQLQIVAPQYLAAADASLFQSSANTTVKIGRAVFTNTSASALTITAGITTLSAALTNATTLISARSIAPGESYVSPELAGAVVPAGSQIHAFASAVTSVSIIVSGLSIV